MRKQLVVVFLVVLTAGLAFASPQADVLAPVHQFVDGFNKGDSQSALAACADRASIIDEFPPYQWSGAGACSTWAQAYMADAKKNGITDAVVTLGKPKHVDIMGNYAYVVMPATYSFMQHGKGVKEPAATFTIALEKSAAGWKITSWTWSNQ